MTDAERLTAYDEELCKVMPDDFKDWWNNSRNEWPRIARHTIESLRDREEWALERVSELVDEVEDWRCKYFELLSETRNQQEF